jgi:hypothetical protein
MDLHSAEEAARQTERAEDLEVRLSYLRFQRLHAHPFLVLVQSKAQTEAQRLVERAEDLGVRLSSTRFLIAMLQLKAQHTSPSRNP